MEGNRFEGVATGPVIQARDVTLRLPATVPAGLGGVRARGAEFVGRTAVLAEVLALIDPRDGGAGVVRVSAVAGMGGVGKTELAVQAAHAATELGWFPGGVLMIDLHGYDPRQRLDEARALASLLRALGVPDEHIPPGDDEKERLYRTVLGAYAERGRPVLVVLDNAAPATPVDRLLPGRGPVLVTSRHALAELPGRLLDLDVLDDDDGVELLRRLITLRRGPADTRVADHPGDARRIAGFCGGLPLALEIVAALLAARPAKPLAELAEELAAEHTRLSTLEYRRRAVRAAFDLSYRALPDGQRRLFRLLAVNRGPRVSTAAATVLAGTDERSTRRDLEELAEAHLIEPWTTPGWWRMHDLVRLYAAETAGAHRAEDGAAGAWDRLLDHYLTTTEKALAHVNPLAADDPGAQGFASRTEAFAWLDAELPNLSAAAFAASARKPSFALLLTLNLARYLERRRLLAEWEALAVLARDTAERVGDRHHEAVATTSVGLVLDATGRSAEAVAAFRRSAELARANGDDLGERTALSNLGGALQRIGRVDEAIGVCRETVRLCRAAADRQGHALALGNLGAALDEAGRTDEAVAVHRKAAELHGRIGDRHGAGAALSNLGVALGKIGRHAEAVRACEEAVAACRETGDRYREGIVLGNLALALRGTGDEAAAVRRYVEAVEALHDSGELSAEAVARFEWGRTLIAAGNRDEALTVLPRAAALHREAGNRHGEASALHALGLGLVDAGRLPDACAALARAADGFAGIDEESRALAASALEMTRKLAALERLDGDAAG
ncbi:ATP-binding protein [Actinomadura rayongensis]|uniref:Tetratricopeptide repeat protein n=1 Tax=Actinomadura rayongensis TaxID=1429076 RepID=A0A6I4W0M1_9ACTN|nr:tetratricopeptide repeat protein [Actinomadura rayongensis]MXQ63797.1 tetratricopeptide repeat protein [Actinomadura rayongensis]